MSPYLDMMNEIASQIPDSWVVDEGWRLIGLPDSRMWLKMDVRHPYTFPKYGEAKWEEARIDLKFVEEPSQRNISTLVGFNNADEAAALVLKAIEDFTV